MLIAQLLFHLESKQYNATNEIVERLKNYANRQLKKEEYFHLIQFIRLLHQAAKADFKLENLSGTEKYIQRIQETPFYFRGLTAELEVIRYEKLWEMIMKKMR